MFSQHFYNNENKWSRVSWVASDNWNFLCYYWKIFKTIENYWKNVEIILKYWKVTEHIEALLNKCWTNIEILGKLYWTNIGTNIENSSMSNEA